MALILTRLLHILLFLAVVSSAIPSQYCRLGLKNLGDGTPSGVDFCIATSLYHNHSTSSHDVFLTIAVRRPANSHKSRSQGWTAVGIGSQMEGALMFVFYSDDPETSDGADAHVKPILSVRTVGKGHAKPETLSQQILGGAETQILNTAWTKAHDGSQYTAEISLVCLACSKWPFTSISPSSVSQPWIWAWNQDQDMAPYSQDVQLEMHDLESGSGFGAFYVDMKNATSHHAEDRPIINMDSANINIGTSDDPIRDTTSLWTYLISRPLTHLHGGFMILAFLFLFPLGAVAVRSGSSSSFKYHWIIQLTATISTITGATIAIIMSDRIFGSPHQIAGFTVVGLLFLQSFLGWRHHIVYLHIQRRTWISYGHIGLGFVLLAGGWGNVISGLALYGIGKLGIALIVLIVSLEIVGVGGWSIMARRRIRAKVPAYRETQDAAPSYFALEDILESDEEEDEQPIGGMPEEERGLMGR